MNFRICFSFKGKICIIHLTLKLFHLSICVGNNVSVNVIMKRNNSVGSSTVLMCVIINKSLC